MKKILLIFVIFLCQTCAISAEYNVYKLPNGQTVVIQEVRNNPIVTIDTWIKTGSVNENEKNNGVSHFLEHLFYKGTKKYPAGEFDKILESKGAVTNAATSKDFTHYYITIPSNYFELALDLHADMLLNPQIPRKELEKERKVVLEEIAKDVNNPSKILYENWNDLLYTTHPYKYPVIGKKDIIENITREEILDYYYNHYAPSNMVTIIIGDVNSAEALEKVKAAFNAEIKKPAKSDYKIEQPLFEQAKKVDYKPVQSGYMIIGFRGVNPSHDDSYALDVLSSILGDGRASRLNQVLKEQRQLVYAVSAGNTSYRDDGILQINANFVPDKALKVENTIFSEIEKIKSHGVTPEELQLAKSLIERDTYYSRESISNISSQLGYTMILTGNPKYYQEYLHNINKVSAADIKRVANKYLGQDKSAVSVILPENCRPSQNSAQKTTDYSAKLVSENGEVSEYKLDKGETLIINNNKQNDIVAFSIYARGGEFLEKIPGTASITASLMTKGTKKYSPLELAQLMEENGITIAPSVRPDAFVINVLTTKAKLDMTFDILNEVVNNASFDDYEIEKARSAKLNSIKKNRDVPVQVAVEEYKTLIFEASPYSNTGKILEKTLPNVEKSDIINYYNNAMATQNIVISVNGDVDNKVMINKFSQIFENKKGNKFEYSSVNNLIPDLKISKTAQKVIPNQQTAWLIFAWQTDGIMKEKDFATLQIINTILGSGMSSRLFKNVRDQEGLAYQLGSNYSPNVLKGSFMVYIGTNPSTLNIAKSKLLEEVFNFKTKFVSNKELQEAKDQLLGRYLIALETNLEKASALGWYEASGRGYKFKDDYTKLINSVTVSDIVDVANRYFTDVYVTSIVTNK